MFVKHTPILIYILLIETWTLYWVATVFFFPKSCDWLLDWTDPTMWTHRETTKRAFLDRNRWSFYYCCERRCWFDEVYWEYHDIWIPCSHDSYVTTTSSSGRMMDQRARLLNDDDRRMIILMRRNRKTTVFNHTGSVILQTTDTFVVKHIGFFFFPLLLE